jgi:hypothetical protein
MRRRIAFLTFLSACSVNIAFVIVPNSHKPSTALFAQDSRRGFLEAATLAASGILWQGSSPAIAYDDLAMPTEGEQAAQAVRVLFFVPRNLGQGSCVLRVACGLAVFSNSLGDLHSLHYLSQKADMEARLKLKAELKAKVAQPKTFQESLQNEMQKQKEDKGKTGEARRNAMCEELGRGC